MIEAARLRELGLTYQQIDERLGLARGCAYRWINSRSIAEYQRRGRARVMAILHEAKQAPCADCGGCFPAVCMDFDHAGSEKTVKLSDWGREVGYAAPALAKLKEEIARCDVVCANCHRIRHAPCEFLVRPAGSPSEAIGKVAA